MRDERRARPWQRRYAIRLFLTDLFIVVLSAFGSQFAWFGVRRAELDLSFASLEGLSVAYTFVSVGLCVLWMLVIQIYVTRDHKIIGSGITEYKRLADATIAVFGFVAIAMYLLDLQLGRGYFLTALPFGLLMLLVGRWSWRQWLVKKRLKKEFVHRVLLVGQYAKNVLVASEIQRHGSAGLLPVGALTKNGLDDPEIAPGVPVLGSFSEVLEFVTQTGVDAVVMTGADDLSPRAMRELGWALDEIDVDLLVAPALTDVAGPRIHARPVAGLPLIHVDYPRIEGTRQVVKRVFDVVAAALGLIVISPLWLLIVIAIKLDSKGPALFVQERIGIGGHPFRMLKFRSMTMDAEDRLYGLLDQSANKVLFKLQKDPRVTRVGSLLRRFSLDELPQLVNVLRGSMSLVGPRPPLAREVALFDNWAQRRLRVKPGITGLWQISGRSNLSWEDSVRLDLYYIENWSLTADFMILYRTVRAVLRSHGAY